MRRSTRLVSKAIDHPPPPTTAPARKRRGVLASPIDVAESDKSAKRVKHKKYDSMPVEQADQATAATTSGAAGESKPQGKAKKGPPASQLDDRQAGETKIWLMKAEPDSRIVKGKDVKFSIDDLAAMPNGTSPWDGVRNHEAKNIMRYKMKAGDTVLFYHSNTKVPGIAGIAQVAKEAYPDHSAFDPNHPYYDEKSDKDDPRWYMVDVQFKRKLQRFLSLKELQEYKDKELKNMPLLTRGRLSVQPVHQQDLDFIIELEQRPGP